MNPRSIRFVAALLGGAVTLGACSASTTPAATAEPALASSSPTTGISAAATPVPSPTRMPGSVVAMTVDGVSRPVSEPVRARGQLPTVVVLTFPFAVDRAGVEQWLPSSAARSWIDDRTLQLSFASADRPVAFKVPETRASAGSAVIDWFTVNITFPDARLIEIYTTAALMSERLPQPALTVRAPPGDGLTVAPDGRMAIVFDGFGPGTGPGPTLLDLDTKATTPLSQPPASDGWFSFADWLPDGRLLMVGRSVWIGDGRGASMRRIADAQAAVGGYPWVAVPDPAGKRLALWGYNADGHIAVIDLADGRAQRITGPFRRSGADGAVSIVWSADGTSIAGTDNDAETGHPTARVRVVDVASDRTLRTLEGDVWWLHGLANGELVIARSSGETGAGARRLGVRTGFDLVEKARYLGCAWSMSRDGRYLLQTECSGGAGHPPHTLIDLRSGALNTFLLQTPASPHWLADGRLAFY